MLVLIDESGDAGLKLGRGSSPFFCILAVIFTDSFDADACDRAIDELRRKMRFPRNYEFHFSRNSESIRRHFFRHIGPERFLYHAFVLNKANLSSSRFSDAKDFYEFAVSIVCDNASSLISDAKVIIDKNGNREFCQRLQRTLKSRLNLDGRSLIRKVAMEDSESNNLLQLADMVCGAVARSITSNDHVHRDSLKKRGHEARVQFWPK
jgi:hypothetical protein